MRRANDVYRGLSDSLAFLRRHVYTIVDLSSFLIGSAFDISSLNNNNFLFYGVELVILCVSFDVLCSAMF